MTSLLHIPVFSPSSLSFSAPQYQKAIFYIYDRACPTNGSDLGSLHSQDLTLFVRIVWEGIKTIENIETISVGNSPLPLVHLADVLQMPVKTIAENPDGTFLHVLVVAFASRRIAIVIDELLGLEEVLVKPLGRQLTRVRHIYGATVLGDGSIALIVNVSDIIQTITTRSNARRVKVKESVQQRKSVLLVEDSVTARVLLKNILESAGYEVMTAVDGMDGLSIFQKNRFDLVVADVEMPKMNGFELTRKIRELKKAEDLPVILVTSLVSPEDRERGMNVGASAYIVKSSLEQSNLLETVRRLI